MNYRPESRHSLAPLLVAQFFGAFNDNAWKLIVVTLGLQVLARTVGPATDLTEHLRQEQQVATLAFLVFILPMVLFSIPAGALADRFSKRSVIVALKAFELLIMAAGLGVLLVTPESTIALLVVLGLLGVQSALFSPAKYGILPELLPHERLSAGNGYLELWTMLAIIAGTGLGPVLLGAEIHYAWIAAVPLVAMAAIGLVASVFLPRLPAATATAATGEPARGVVQSLRVGGQVIWQDRIVWLTVVGLVIYWTLVSLLGQNLIIYTHEITKEFPDSEKFIGIPLAVFGLGVALGALAAGRLSQGKVEYGLIPLGATVFSLFTLALSLAQPGFWGTLIVMPFLGIASGLVAVPLNALLQWKAPADRRGAVIALTNVFVLLGTAAGSLGAYALAHLGYPPAGIFLAGALAVLAATIWSIYLLPEALLRLIAFLLTHTFYRIEVVGRENVPQQGGVLLTPNHVSFIDGLLVMASIDRPVRFLVYEWYVNVWWLRPFMKIMRSIPVASSGGPRAILRALRDAGNHLDQGEVVCIFPEGQLTRSGMMMPFRRGMERLVKGRDACIIPVYLDRVWGSIFSHAGGRFLWKIPRELPYRVQIRFGKPLPADTTVREVRRTVHEMSEAAWRDRMAERPPLHHTLIRSMRHRWWAFAFGDAIRPRVSRILALTGSIAFARALRTDWQGQSRVGILLPPSVAGALVNFAATMSGRTTVNLNYTVGPTGLTSAARQAELKTVVTSKAFLEKSGVQLPEGVRPIFVEEVFARITFGARLWARLLAHFASARGLEQACGAERPVSRDDVVTVIFSSGSTGEPKGVELTHSNLDANVEGCAQVFPLDPEDRVLGILPLFHSFGYMTTWLCANRGVGLFFHPNPLDAIGIGEIVEKQRITILISTPTFLQLYMKRVAPPQFGSLRVVLTGAEKLPPRVAEAFQTTFGIRPIEGYGTTECAPVVAVSTLDYRGPGLHQTGSRVGSVGHLLPGVTLRLVDPDTGAPLPSGDGSETGQLLVKGPNIMRGYLGKPELTSQVLRDGWYDTGDIAQIDEDGFLRITDRKSRFSKIGGEMVPHGRVEEALQEAAGAEIQMFAVTAIPDEKKGERLAVIHTVEEAKIPGILAKVSESGLPNLFIPRADQFLRVEQLPMLGTGKIDLRAVKKIAMERLASV